MHIWAELWLVNKKCSTVWVKIQPLENVYTTRFELFVRKFLRIARKSQPHPIGCAQLTECHKWMHGHWVRNAKCITSTRASIITLLTQWVSEIVLHHVHWTSHPHPDNNRIHDQLYLLCHHKGPVNSHWCRVRVGWICSTRTSYCVFDIWECMLQNTINVLLCTRTTWRVAIHEQCLACEQE